MAGGGDGDGDPEVELDPPPPAYTPVVWDGNMPAPQGKVAKEMDKISRQQQRDNMEEFYS